MIRRLCQLSSSAAEECEQRFFEILTDSLGIDSAAILEHEPREGVHRLRAGLGCPPGKQIALPGPHAGAFHLAAPGTPGPLAESLRQAAGVQHVIWVLDLDSGKSLLLGSANGQTARRFSLDASCWDLAASALALYVMLGEISGKRSASLARCDSNLVLVIRADSTIGDVSQSTEQILGFGAKDLVGSRAVDLIHPEDAARIRLSSEQALRESGSGPVEIRLRHADGSWRFFEAMVSDLLDDPAVERLVIDARDITERRLLEEEREILVRDMGERVKELCCMYEVADAVRESATPEGVFYKIAALLPSGWRYPEIARGRVVFDDECYVTEPFMETDWKQSSDIVVSGLRRGAVEVFYLQQRAEADEGPFCQEERLLLDNIARTVSEMVERKQVEEARDEAERELEEQKALSIVSDRLRSLGEMAAGIAHELNQPLVGVRGLAEHILIGLARGWKFTDESIRQKIQLIIEQAERMTHIIEHVRVFAKEAGKPEVRRIRVNDVILSSVGLVSAQLKARGVELEHELADGLPDVLANPFSLEEVILNLISNARDAVEEKIKQGASSSKPMITLKTRHDTAAGHSVKIDVIDHGIGIPADVLPKVFDPFFTTKGPDRGTGLGLAVSRSIVEECDGLIEIRSSKGEGTTVTLSLKAVP
ncbi:MAG: PAS domain S-box protein [Deltaproteobacteria bacterium]|nr:PAS domain S-box protein [Deltaproteobacteria bacterium]